MARRSATPTKSQVEQLSFFPLMGGVPIADEVEQAFADVAPPPAARVMDAPPEAPVAPPITAHTAGVLLRDAQVRYQDFLLSLGRSRHTAATQRTDLGLLIGHLGDRPAVSVTLDDLRGFVAWLRIERGNDARSLRRKVATVKGFFSYLYREAVIPTDPARQLLYPVAAPRVPEALETREAEAVARAAEQHPLWLALVLTVLDAGLKRDEVLALDVADLVLDPADEAALVVRATRDAQNVRPRRLLLTDRLRSAFQTHLGERQDGPVFPLSVRAINFIIAECGRKGGVRKRGPVTPQMLRDTFALTHMRTMIQAEATAARQDTPDPDRTTLRGRHNRQLLALLGLAEDGDGAMRYRVLANPLPAPERTAP